MNFMQGGRSGPRDETRRRILLEIRKQGQIARIDIARATGLSPATVTTVTGELLEAGVLRRAQPGPGTSRGRPREALELRADALTLAGLRLTEDAMKAVVVGFTGEILGETETARPNGWQGVDDIVDTVERLVGAVLDNAGQEARALSGIGLGVPGFVEAGRGLVRWSSAIPGGPVDLQDILAARFAAPVLVDNDANLATLAELWFGMGRGMADFATVSIDRGVGMGLVLGGALHRGTRRIGPELGHMKIVADGALCRCGQRGCLEAYVADYALAAQADLPLETLLERLNAGDAAAVALFRQAARMLGIGLANLVNIVDPPVILLSGERSDPILRFIGDVRGSMAENAILGGADLPEIRPHIWRDSLWARGAAALALEGSF